MRAQLEPPPDVIWRPAPGLQGINLLEARACRRSWRVFHETYAFCTVLRVRSGRGTIRYRRWSYDAEPGTVQAFEPGELQRCDTLRGCADYRGLFIPKQVLLGLSPNLRFGGTGPHCDTPLVTRGFEAFSRFHSTLEASDPDPLAVDCLLIEVVSQFLRAASPAAHRSTVDEVAISRAREYVEDRLAQDLSTCLRLGDLATAAGSASPFSLSRDFQRCFGVSPIAYVRSRRLARGQALLRAGRTARRVAMECGYSEEAFSRLFTREFGMAPGQFRAAHRPPAAQRAVPQLRR